MPSQSDERPPVEDETRSQPNRSRTAPRRSRFESQSECPPRTNAGDALLNLARDVVRAHVDAYEGIADALVPRSLGTGRRWRGRVWASGTRGRSIYEPGLVLRRMRRIADVLSPAPSSIEETHDSYVLEFEVPGWNKDEISVRVGPDVVMVHAERPQDAAASRSEQDRDCVYDAEWVAPEELDDQAVSATLRNGVLRLTFRKLVATQAREVKIT